MSAPIQRDDSFVDERFYAPPWARGDAPDTPERVRSASAPPVAPAPDGAPWQSPARPSPFAGDRAMGQLRRRTSLDPELAPEPPVDLHQRRLIPWVVRIMLALVAASGAVYGVSPRLVDSTPVRPAPTPTPVVAQPKEPPKDQLKDQPNDQRKDQAWTLASVGTAPQPALPARPAVEPRPAAEDEPASGIAPPASEPKPEFNSERAQWPDRVEAPPSQPSAPPADPEETAALVKRGFEFMKSGDLAAARLLLQRAARAGHPEAALTLGASYDPAILAGLGVVGVTADVDQARTWYQRALDLGSAEASRRIEQLAFAERR